MIVYTSTRVYAIRNHHHTCLNVHLGVYVFKPFHYLSEEPPHSVITVLQLSRVYQLAKGLSLTVLHLEKQQNIVTCTNVASEILEIQCRVSQFIIVVTRTCTKLPVSMSHLGG